MTVSEIQLWDTNGHVEETNHSVRDRSGDPGRANAATGSDDANTRGVLIPTAAVDQYGSTLAQWFGVAPANLPQVFPNIANFGSNKLGFVGGGRDSSKLELFRLTGSVI
jgi:hypothetical protein